VTLLQSNPLKMASSRTRVRRARRLEREGLYQEAIHELSAVADSAAPGPALDELGLLRHRACSAYSSPSTRAEWPPDLGDRFAGHVAPPEVHASELDAGAISAGISRYGSVVVREFLGATQVERLQAVLERTFDEADRTDAPDPEWFRPFPLGAGEYNRAQRRRWDRDAGAVWLGDAPRALHEVLAAYGPVGFPGVLTDYFGERPVFSLEKSTLRWAKPAGAPQWHQDGAFMGGNLRTLNIWTTLTACGGEEPVPALDILPRRFDEIVETGTRGATLDDFVGADLIGEIARETPIVRPRFEPGDALIFDDHTLHNTAIDPGMTGDRMAIEFWLFSPGTMPENYLPMAL
jgi:hypothetical protein